MFIYFEYRWKMWTRCLENKIFMELLKLFNKSAVWDMTIIVWEMELDYFYSQYIILEMKF